MILVFNRYVFPVVPLIILAADYALVTIGSWVRSKARRSLADGAASQGPRSRELAFERSDALLTMRTKSTRLVQVSVHSIKLSGVTL